MSLRLRAGTDAPDEQKKEIQEIQNKLRKQIADRFSKHPKLEIQKKYKNLFGKELINIDLKEFVETEIDKSIVDIFEKFTTYFTGFNENRKNMYTAEDKSTAISYRLIHHNLPKFIDNLKIFEKLKESEINSELVSIQNEIGNFFKINNINEVFQLDYFNEVLSQTGIDIYNQVIGGYTTNDGKTKIKGLNEYINLFNQNVKDKKNKIGKFKLLFKQILSDRNTASAAPRPASPFNWTAIVFDGERYHYAHINTRRSEPLVATDDDNFIRRFSAPYMPVAMAQWEVRERFGNGSTRALAEQVWNAEDFAFYRWFAMFPVLDHAGEDGDGQVCASFKDLRFLTPGRDRQPFIYGLCNAAGGWRLFEREAGGLRWIDPR